jgi:hypothetical protein
MLTAGLFSISGSSPKAGVANIGRKEARDAIVAGMSAHSASGSLKRYPLSWNPLSWAKRWQTGTIRKNARQLLKDTNKIPQEMLDPVRKVEVKKFKGDAVAYAQGKDITLHPFKDQTKYGSMLHEPHHVYTFNKRLQFLNEADKHRTIKARATTLENQAQHLSKTYEKNYGTISSEVSAREFERRGLGFTQKTPKKEWAKAYDESLDQGLDSMQAHYPDWETAMRTASRQTHQHWRYKMKQKEALQEAVKRWDKATPPPLPKKRPAGRNET